MRACAVNQMPAVQPLDGETVASLSALADVLESSGTAPAAASDALRLRAADLRWHDLACALSVDIEHAIGLTAVRLVLRSDLDDANALAELLRSGA